MANLLQQQLLKAGVVSKQQVKKAESAKRKGKKKKQGKAVNTEEAERKQQLQQAAREKAERDRELNLRKEQQAKQKAISAEIDQLIQGNMLQRDDDCDIHYHFEHRNKVNHIHVNPDMRQKIIDGELGIARIQGRYELVPKDTAIKIQQRNDKRVILFTADTADMDDSDPYAEFPIPDDLIW